MISFLIFFAVIGILAVSGWCMTRLLCSDRRLQCVLAFPLGSLTTILLVFLFTITAIPLAPWSFLLGHGVAVAVLLFLHTRLMHGRANGAHGSTHIPQNRVLMMFCLVILAVIAVFSVARAVVLSTSAVDSFTNWTMRSKVSFEDRAVAFDETEARGMAKPQYPFLVHALQIAANQGQREWNDRMANSATLLLSLATFASAFLLLRNLRGTTVALMTLTLLASVPLLSMQLAQGYGDVHLVEFLMLGFLSLMLFRERKQTSWLILSALCITAALWTKLEGFWFGWIPWALLVLLTPRAWCLKLFAAGLPLLLFLPFLILLRSKGLPLSPHAWDFGLAWHPETLPSLRVSLWEFGSFGIAWYVLPVAILVLWRSPHRPLFLWGGIALLELLTIYTLTPNAQHLISGEAFSRQALIPLALLITAAAACVDTGTERRNPR